jgi:hypothetical protein
MNLKSLYRPDYIGSKGVIVGYSKIGIERWEARIYNE